MHKLVIEGPRDSQKTTRLAQIVVDRVQRGMHCWVFALSDTQLELIQRKIEEEVIIAPCRRLKAPQRVLEYEINGKTRVKFSVMCKKAWMDLNSVDIENTSLFLNDCEWKIEDVKTTFEGKPMSWWREVVLTRCTGPDSPGGVI